MRAGDGGRALAVLLDGQQGSGRGLEGGSRSLKACQGPPAHRFAAETDLVAMQVGKTERYQRPRQ